MRNLALIAAALAAGAGIATASLGQGAAVLPPGPGHDVMVRVCSGCHAPEVAAQQRLSREAWAETVDLMASRGAQGTDAEFAQIVDYLSASFPAKAAAAGVPSVAVPPSSSPTPSAAPTPHGG
jgi:mono/diheme cytochrome c family protein